MHARGAPLDQIARRIVESTTSSKMEPIIFDVPKWQSCLKYNSEQQTKSIYNAYKYIQISPNVYLSIRKPGDRFFLTKEKLTVEMKCAFQLSGEYFVCGEVFSNKTSFFKDPLDSEYIDIYVTNALHFQGHSSYFNIDRIGCKLQRLSYKNSFVFMPFLHSLTFERYEKTINSVSFFSHLFHFVSR